MLGRFCWSDACGNCEVFVTEAGGLLPARVRNRQSVVAQGMSLSDLRYWIHRKL